MNPKVQFKNILAKHGPIAPFLLFVVLVLLGFVAYPNLHLLQQSFFQNNQLTFSNYLAFFDTTHSSNLEALWGSVTISVLTVLFSALVGVPLAYFFTHYTFPGKSVFASLAVLPIVMPPLVGVLAFLFLFGESGILPRAIQTVLNLKTTPFSINGITAILVVHTYSFYVYFYLFASNFYNDLDASILEAARNLGAGKGFTLRKIILPMMTPALSGAALLVFMTSMASFSAPFIFANATRILSLEIYQTKLNGNLDLAVTQSVILASFSIVFLILLRMYSSRKKYISGSKGVKIKTKVIQNGVARWLISALGIVAVILLILPHLTVILISFVENGTWTWQMLPPSYTLDNYMNLFEDPKIVEPIANSLKMATFATLGNLIFGITAAYLLIRKKFAGKKIIETLIMLPWAIPGTVLAIGLIVAFNTENIFTFGNILVGTFWILPLAYFIRNLPLVFRSTYAALENFEPAQEEAARNLGASWFFAFRKVILPAIAPGILSGALLAFVLALGEFVSSILLYNYYNRPISVEIISQLRVFNLGSAAAYSVFLIIIIGMVVIISNRFLSKKAGQVVV